ncbi:DUF4845 domain-containing protein [uncultured Oxalicibacterium sp.]|uniref:DUF4845 domain-containing protein n=1 Tax=uncultured Oxalicibacterium sp. TaxID=1168540 RepID=UPI0025FE7E2D|nr:DUF4845 domain-containing protein [uncultured Oxalicibacterium sp.]
MTSTLWAHRKQQGLSLTGLILALVLIGGVAVLAMKVVPTVTEYLSAKKAIASVKAAGGSPAEMRAAFNRQAEVGYITSLKGSDLDIVRNGDNVQIGFSYQKQIPLVGPVSLLIDYEASTDR